MAGYGDDNRAFLQALMAHGSLTLDSARPLLAALLTTKAALDADRPRSGPDDNRSSSPSRGAGPRTYRPEDVTQAHFDAYLAAASAALSHFDYEVRRLQHQRTRTDIHAVVNTASDPPTQLATSYSHDELAFVRRLLDCLFDTHNTPRMELMAFTEMEAVKLRRPDPSAARNSGIGADAAADAAAAAAAATQRGDDNDEYNAPPQNTQAADKGLKTSEVERVLSGLLSEGWLDRSRAGFYSPGTRLLLELRGWLVDSYNDADVEEEEEDDDDDEDENQPDRNNGKGTWQRIKFCAACKDIVTDGLRCPDRDCVLRLHDACDDAFWRSRRDGACPRCKTVWGSERKHFVGERAMTSTKAYERGRRRGGPSGSSGGGGGGRTEAVTQPRGRDDGQEDMDIDEDEDEE